VRQVVVLGAGLDTLALREPHAGRGVRVFEVDHPATQEWKRRRLAQAGLPMPASLTFAPVDFERDRLADGLRAAGFDGGRPAFFLWLGVVPYLTRAAITGTLRFIASVPGAEVVFDYAEPPESLPAGRRARAAELGARTRAAGEPLLSHFEPAELAAELREHGFHELEDLGPDDLAARFSESRRDRPPSGGGPHVIRAVRAGAT
jgi:methyltransferase (TIGR00027 family)